VVPLCERTAKGNAFDQECIFINSSCSLCKQKQTCKSSKQYSGRKKWGLLRKNACYDTWFAIL